MGMLFDLAYSAWVIPDPGQLSMINCICCEVKFELIQFFAGKLAITYIFHKMQFPGRLLITDIF
jgi:hypothetical protein